MIRSINEIFGYVGYSETDGTYDTIIDTDHYPEQDGDMIGKFVTLRFDCLVSGLHFPRFRFPSQVLKKNQYGIDFSKTIYRDEYESALPFEIVRFDKVFPFRVILVSTWGHTVIMTAEEFEDAITFANESYCFNSMAKIQAKGYEVYFGKEVSEYDLLSNYGAERVFTLPIQANEILGKSVWIEYQNDIVKPINGTINPPKNVYKFTDDMKAALIAGDNRLKNTPDEQLASYPYYHNTHAESYVDNPRRSFSMGIVIRVDMGSSLGDTCVVYTNYNGDRRFLLADEARFFFDTKSTRVDFNIPTPYESQSGKSIFKYLHTH